ncbi:MAG: hypothetical protein ACE5GT_03395 [Rhodospirillales bacterium]
MIGALQKFDFLSSAYQRPNQEWVCGRQAEGRPCQIGPDAKGVCRADYECQPMKRDDRWHCTRSDYAGGRCEKGPFPDSTCCRPVPRCRPVMNWRARPKAMGRRVAALTFGLLLILLAGSGGPAFIDPGPITFQHAGVKDCGGCHTAFSKGATAWVRAAFAENTDVDDSKLCLACHDLGQNVFQPHSLSPFQLAALTENVNTTTIGSWAMTSATAAMVLGPPHKDGGELSCMTCHREHHGNAFDLTAMRDSRCQVCHTFQFTSLSQGHPEFFDYPYNRRTRIVFDHASHIEKHFRDRAMRRAAPKECKSCHTPDANGRLMLINGFDDNCVACHGGQVEGVGRATAKGLPVLNVPGLDVLTLEERQIDIGAWPEDADGEMTPFMDFLLAGDKEYDAARTTLAGLDLLDLTDAGDAQIAAVEALAWRVKELLFDLAVDGLPALKPRLEAALGRGLRMAEIAELAGLLPVDAVRSAQKSWFPGLARDVLRHRQTRANASPGAGRGLGAPSSAGNDSGDLLGGKEGGGLLSGDKEDGGLLSGDNEGGGLLSGDKEDGGLLSGDKEGGGLLSGDKEAGDGKPAARDGQEQEEMTVDMAAGEEWSAAGGWYRDDFTLRYRPTGHADRFLKAWLDVTGQAMAAKSAGRRIFEMLGSAKAPGLCAKCHSIDAGAGGTFMVNWRGSSPLPGKHRSTIFSHTAHFSLLDEKGCLTCHDPNVKAKYAESFADRNPATFASNFWSIEREDCAACHTPAEAGDTCVKCHNYHIGTFRPAIATMREMTFTEGN